MARSALAALLLLAAAPAAAGWRSFPASEPGACAGDLFVFSPDGWHYACAQKGGGPDLLVRDGLPVATLKPSQLSGQFPYESVMSPNGRVVLHQLAAMDAQGTVTGVQAAINGTPFGKVYQDIGFMSIADNGADLAYAGKEAGGWRVVTAAAEGPLLEAGPMLAGLGVVGRVAYIVQPPQGAARLYINHQPVKEQDLYGVAVSPDMKRRVVFRSNPEVPGIVVDAGMGAKPEGPWMGAGSTSFAPDGRAYAYAARSNPGQYDSIMWNGKRYGCPEPLTIFRNPAGPATILFSPRGSPAWVCRSKLDTLYFEGKPVVSFSGNQGSVAFTPGGKPGVLVTKGETGAVLTGAGVAAGLPKPAGGGQLGFDAEDEFHYYGRVDGQVALVCAAFGAKEPSACAAKARRLYRGN